MSTSPSNDALRNAATEALKAADRVFGMACAVHEANATEHDPADWAWWMVQDAKAVVRMTSALHARVFQATEPQTEEPW